MPFSSSKSQRRKQNTLEHDYMVLTFWPDCSCWFLRRENLNYDGREKRGRAAREPRWFERLPHKQKFTSLILTVANASVSSRTTFHWTRSRKMLNDFPLRGTIVSEGSFWSLGWCFWPSLRTTAGCEDGANIDIEALMLVINPDAALALLQWFINILVFLLSQTYEYSTNS